MSINTFSMSTSNTTNDHLNLKFRADFLGDTWEMLKITLYFLLCVKREKCGKFTARSDEKVRVIARIIYAAALVRHFTVCDALLPKWAVHYESKTHCQLKTWSNSLVYAAVIAHSKAVIATANDTDKRLKGEKKRDAPMEIYRALYLASFHPAMDGGDVT